MPGRPSANNSLVLSLLTLFILIAPVTYSFEPGAIERLQADISYMCSPLLAGRDTPGPDGDKTAFWIAERFRSLGMKPGFGETDYYQRVPLHTAKIDTVQTRLKISSSTWQKELHWGRDFYAFPKHIAEFDTTIEIKYCGLAILLEHHPTIDDSVTISNIFPRAVSGKAAMFDIGAGDIADAEAGRFSMTPFKAAAAGREGAVMSIAFNRMNREWPPISINSKVNDLAKPMVDLPDSEIDLPIVYINERAVESVIDDIMATRSSIGEKVTISITIRFEEVHKTHGFNVVGLIDGSSYEYVMLSAHYDHLGRVNSGNPTLLMDNPSDTSEVSALQYYPGADDNASGVAAMLEVCRSWSNTPTQVKGLLAVAFTAEEDGLLGSKWMTANLPIAPENLSAVLNLDMIGRSAFRNMRDSRRPGAIPDSAYLAAYYSAASPELGNVLRAAGSLIDLDINYQALNSFAHFGDVSSFHNIEVPSIHFFTGFHSDYSTPGDTPDKIDFGKLSRICDMIRETLVNVSDTKGTITFDPDIKVKSSGMPY